jgi:Flp pilus assembly protein TadD
LKKKASRGIFANTASFCAVLANQGKLYVVEITDYSPEKATLNVLKLEDSIKKVNDMAVEYMLPDADDIPGANVVLDLASGELLPVLESGDDQSQIFRDLGKGDLVYDGNLHCLRGAKLRAIVEDKAGKHLVLLKDMAQMQQDTTSYGLEPQRIPGRYLITTGEGDDYEVNILSADASGLKLSYTKSFKPNPLKAEDLIAEGWQLLDQGKLPEAEVKFKEAIRTDPDNENAYQGLGWAQLNQGKKQNAKASFFQCLTLNPESSAAVDGLGWYEHGQGNIDRAIKCWNRAVMFSNGTATASLNGLTQVYMDRQDYSTAVKYYEMWLKTEPNNQDAKDGLAKAQAAMN